MEEKLEPHILIITACGRSKNDRPLPAWKLYKSSRVKAVYYRVIKHDFAILSSEYGLVEAERVISPYEKVMTKRRAEELIPQVTAKLKNYDLVIYYKGGARREYYNCIRNACQAAGNTLIVLGFANMGGINDIIKVIALAEQGKFGEILNIKHTEVISKS